MNTYKIIVAYDGTPFHGWQIQPNGISIQAKIQDALTVLLKQPITVIGASRTDAGVHALGQVAHFHCQEEIDCFRFFRSLNGLLPHEIRIKSIEKAPSSFHAQYSALQKTYHYHLCLGPIQEPFRRLYSLHVLHKVDCNLLQEGAALFVGTHDFTSFANEAHHGRAAINPIRTLFKVNCVEEGENEWRIEFSGDGFLYKMVRNIAGTLLDVGSGKLRPEDIPALFECRDRRQTSQAVPPHGLFLIHVTYE